MSGGGIAGWASARAPGDPHEDAVDHFMGVVRGLADAYQHAVHDKEQKIIARSYSVLPEMGSALLHLQPMRLAAALYSVNSDQAQFALNQRPEVALPKHPLVERLEHAPSNIVGSLALDSGRAINVATRWLFADSKPDRAAEQKFEDAMLASGNVVGEAINGMGEWMVARNLPIGSRTHNEAEFQKIAWGARTESEVAVADPDPAVPHARPARTDTATHFERRPTLVDDFDRGVHRDQIPQFAAMPQTTFESPQALADGTRPSREGMGKGTSSTSEKVSTATAPNGGVIASGQTSDRTSTSLLTTDTQRSPLMATVAAPSALARPLGKDDAAATSPFTKAAIQRARVDIQRVHVPTIPSELPNWYAQMRAHTVACMKSEDVNSSAGTKFFARRIDSSLLPYATGAGGILSIPLSGIFLGPLVHHEVTMRDMLTHPLGIVYIAAATTAIFGARSLLALRLSSSRLTASTAAFPESYVLYLADRYGSQPALKPSFDRALNRAAQSKNKLEQARIVHNADKQLLARDFAQAAKFTGSRDTSPIIRDLERRESEANRAFDRAVNKYTSELEKCIGELHAALEMPELPKEIPASNALAVEKAPAIALPPDGSKPWALLIAPLGAAKGSQRLEVLTTLVNDAAQSETFGVSPAIQEHLQRLRAGVQPLLQEHAEALRRAQENLASATAAYQPARARASRELQQLSREPEAFRALLDGLEDLSAKWKGDEGVAAELAQLKSAANTLDEVAAEKFAPTEIAFQMANIKLDRSRRNVDLVSQRAATAIEGLISEFCQAVSSSEGVKLDELPGEVQTLLHFPLTAPTPEQSESDL